MKIQFDCPVCQETINSSKTLCVCGYLNISNFARHEDLYLTYYSKDKLCLYLRIDLLYKPGDEYYLYDLIKDEHIFINPFYNDKVKHPQKIIKDIETFKLLQ